MMQRRRFVGCAAALAAAGLSRSVYAATDVIRIGEINSYKALPAFLEPYRKGMDLAVEQINAAGGVLGKTLEVVTRDDNANPGDTVRMAQQLLSREKVDVLAGNFLSNTGMALSDFAKQRRVFFLAGEPLTDKLTWEGGNEYTFRLRPGTYMQTAMLVPQAAALNKKRWALAYPNYEYGQAAATAFKRLLREQQPDVEFVAELATPFGKVDAGSTVQALSDAKPDAIFNALFAVDLIKFVREGNTRGLFKGREVVSLLSGEPEYLDTLKEETPDGWYVTGYPWYSIETPEHQAFLDAYQKRFNDYPRQGSIVGYAMIKSLGAGIQKAGSTKADDLIGAFKGLSLMTPFGEITYRPQDHQSTLGAYVGRTKQVDGKGVMVDFTYCDGADFQPSDAEVAQFRSRG